MASWLWPKTMSFYREWLQFPLGATLKGVRVATSAWLGRWRDRICAGFLSAGAVSCFQIQALSFLTMGPSSTRFSFTPQLSTFPLSATELFQTLLIHPAAAAAFLFLFFLSHPSSDLPFWHGCPFWSLPTHISLFPVLLPEMLVPLCCFPVLPWLVEEACLGTCQEHSSHEHHKSITQATACGKGQARSKHWPKNEV